jgi:hypothetical protein
MRCATAYRRGGDRTRRLFNAAVLDQVHVRDGHVIEAAYKEPFDLLFSVPKFEYDDVVDLRREFSNSVPSAKSLVKRLVQRVGETAELGSVPVFEDSRGPNVRELRQQQRRLSGAEVDALIADYEAGGRVGELAKVYGIHRTTAASHVARAGKSRGGRPRTWRVRSRSSVASNQAAPPSSVLTDSCPGDASETRSVR